jgi:hypothetical protein
MIDIENNKHILKFDVDFYQNYYNDLNNLSIKQLYLHYINTGRYEGRYINRELFLNKNPIFIVSLEQLNIINKLKIKNVGKIVEILINNHVPFNENNYKKLNKDLDQLSETDLLAHYVNNGFFEHRIYHESQLLNPKLIQFFILKQTQIRLIHEIENTTKEININNYFKNLEQSKLFDLKSFKFKYLDYTHEENIYSVTPKKLVNTNINPIITFIIPTIGRESLILTLNSLFSQTNENWNALIIFDNVGSNIKVNDSRVNILEYKNRKFKYENNAGHVRNFGLNHVKTQWVGFVDDDDTIDKHYIINLENDKERHPTVDCVIFRMVDKQIILPEIDDKMFYKNFVGISFAINYKVYKETKIKFKSELCEDFKFLDEIRRNKLKILISKHINYYVKNKSLENKPQDEIPEYVIN